MAGATVLWKAVILFFVRAYAAEAQTPDLPPSPVAVLALELGSSRHTHLAAGSELAQRVVESLLVHHRWPSGVRTLLADEAKAPREGQKQARS